MQTYKPNLTLRVLIALFLLLPGVVLLGVAVGNPDVRMPCGIIGAILFVPGLLLWIVSGRMSLTVDGDTVTRRGAFGSVVTLRFDEVTEYRYQAVEMRGTETINLSLHARDGRKIKISSNWRDIYGATQLLVEAVESRLLQPSYGPITLEADAIVYQNKRVPYDEVSGVTLNGARLRVARKHKLLAAFAVGSLKVPNVFLLLDELRARGVGAPDARPWRAVVNLSGYQLPKS